MHREKQTRACECLTVHVCKASRAAAGLCEMPDVDSCMSISNILEIQIQKIHMLDPCKAIVAEAHTHQARVLAKHSAQITQKTLL